MSTPEEPPFIMRAWSVNAAIQPEETRFSRLGDAIMQARALASDPRYRSVEVLDVNSMRFAQFNCLWSVPADYA